MSERNEQTGRAADGALAHAVAADAGARLLEWRMDDERRLLADVLADDHIRARLRAARPDDVIFSEEAPDDPARLTAHRVWIVDPLDGTREYREPGRIDWAVHVALWQDGTLIAGAVALPALSRVLSTISPPDVPPRAPGRRLRIVVSRSRPPAFAGPLAATLDAELVHMGSAGAKVAAVISGDADAYVHAGGQYEWDSAAPVAVAMAAGLHASTLGGAPLIYNGIDPRMPDLLVCRPELAARIIGRVR